MKRITEKQLRNLVAESVRRCLNEGTPKKDRDKNFSKTIDWGENEPDMGE